MSLSHSDGDSPGPPKDPTSGISFFGRQRKPSPEAPIGVSAGQELAGFRLIRLIGQGGMGQVWEAEQVSVKRRVALKLVRPEIVSQDALDLFAREARAGARFHHTGIVDVHDHGTSGGVAWISMEFVEGSWTLRDFLADVAQQDELPEHYYRDVARLVAKVADAMEAVHEQGVIHLDVKPANILITENDEPKVTDFGLARITDESGLSRSGEIAGTYAYMSPEQVAAKRIGIDHRTDLFSLGVVLYELLTFRRPFEGDTTQQIARQIILEDPRDPRELRSKVPRNLSIICKKCLRKDPDLRYATSADLAADLRRYLADQPILAKPAGPFLKLQLWARRNPTVCVAGGVAGVAFVLISLLIMDNVRARSEVETQKLERRAAAIRGVSLSTNAGLEFHRLYSEGVPRVPGHRERALQYYQEALRLNGENPLTHYNMATILIDSENFEDWAQALGYLQTAHSLGHDATDLTFILQTMADSLRADDDARAVPLLEQTMTLLSLVEEEQ